MAENETKKYLVGSKLLGLSNAKDTDYVVLVKKNGVYKRVIEDGADVLYISEEYVKQIMSFTFNSYTYSINAFNYDANIIGQDFPIEYHILDYKKELKALLQYIAKNNLFNFNDKISVDGSMSPNLYRVYYNYCILENNSVFLTAIQKENVQKIHDKEMPISFLNELKEKILKLSE